MHGEDKGLIELHHQPLIRYIIERLHPQVGAIRLSVNRNISSYETLGYPTFTDADQDYHGPLSGMLGAMRSESENDWLLCVPCDAPLLPLDLAKRLCHAVDQQTRVAVAHDGKWMQPTFCLIHRSLANDLEQYIENGGRKTGAWLRQNQAVEVDFSDQKQAFTNINTPEELEQIQAQIKSI
jgi:molybdopterin-guanine dinucleotide biosynthesis protein A